MCVYIVDNTPPAQHIPTFFPKSSLTRILCLADDPADAAALEGLLEQQGYTAVLASGDGQDYDPEADASIAAIVVVCQRPDHFGLKFLARFDDRRGRPPVVVLSGDSSVEHAVYCMRSGAADYLPKPVRADTLAMALEHARAQTVLQTDRAGLSRAVRRADDERRIAGRSEAIRELRHLIGLVAPTDAAVMIEGESGTGKELVARALHAQSRRSTGPFITINCAAMPEGLVESTLFGHEKGAFTGATARAAGVFERANGGTLFLDEISEMRLDLQAKLLRVLQESEYERVGGRELLRTDVRVVVSTNRDLAAEVAAGRFRSDLYYRLHVMPVKTPPLRERPEDIADLIDCHLPVACALLGVPVPDLPPATMDVLESHAWPGNVRELLNALHRAVILSAGAALRPEHFRLNAQTRETAAARSIPSELPLNLAELEAMAIARALEESEGHRANAAKLLGISERTLRNRLNTPGPMGVVSGRIDRGGEILSA